MNCSFTEKVSSLIDGELSATETREVERHLLSCSECQQMRADFLNLRSQVTSFETSLQPEVQNRALKKILTTTERRVPARWSFGTQAVAFASLLIVAAIIGALVYLNSNTREQHTAVVQDPAPAPSVEQTDVSSKQPEAKPSPEPAKENEPQPAPNKTEENTPRRAPSTPVKRPLVREPKPGEQFAAIPEPVRPADAQTMTAMHFEKSETLLRAFRNARLNEPGGAAEIGYERKRAQQLVVQNMMLRREADAAGDVQISSLLESLEPILIDISNLPNKPDKDSVRAIRERVERKNIVALLQVNSTALARALD